MPHLEISSEAPLVLKELADCYISFRCRKTLFVKRFQLAIISYPSQLITYITCQGIPIPNSHVLQIVSCVFLSIYV